MSFSPFGTTDCSGCGKPYVGVRLTHCKAITCLLYVLHAIPNRMPIPLCRVSRLIVYGDAHLHIKKTSTTSSTPVV